jgi:outer membrane protein assembly factor BamD
MKKLLPLLSIVLMFFASSCTEYRKVLKSTDMQYKYDMALQYMKSEKYAKAYPLLDELYIMYRGTQKGEKIAYNLAQCEYGMKDYILAAHRFGQFHKSYPNSEYAEKSQFLSAYCNYKLSPKYSLDQSDTYKAIKSFQLFALQHPESKRIDSCNQFLDDLRYKIELKDYKTSKLYYKRERYRAASVAFKNFNDRYPNSRYKEETWFLWYKSTYLLAINSIPDKKIERIEASKEAYTTFADRFPNSKYLKDASDMNSDIEKKLVYEQNQN